MNQLQLADFYNYFKRKIINKRDVDLLRLQLLFSSLNKIGYDLAKEQGKL